MTLSGLLVVTIGGAVGTALRFILSVMAAPLDRHLPWGTILINATGSFAIGLFSALTLPGGRHPASENARLFVMIGLCGGYTTFSSFSLQTFDLLHEGSVARAGVNVLLSVALCILAIAAGHLIATRFGGGA